MDNALVHRRRLVVLALAVALALAVVVVLPKASSAEPPEPIEVSFEAPGFCDFAVLVELTGKTKTIELPDGSLLITAPGQRITLTNLEEPDNKLSFGIQGTARQRELENGDLLVVGRGRNVLADPGEGMFLFIGRVKFIQSPTGGEFVDLTILENKGKVIDLCAALEGEAAEE